MKSFIFTVIGLFSLAMIAMNYWEVTKVSFERSDYKPKYSQCENVYVRKSPHPCNAGDLIYIDADVADKYCGRNIIGRFGDSVYCQYNGYRDDLPKLTSL